MRRVSKLNKVRITVMAILASMAIGAISYVLISKPISRADSEETIIKILHTNDIHANIEDLSYVSQYKKETENSVLVDSGDAAQGQSLATYTKGSAIIELQNEASYDVSAVGNHDFDYGIDQFKSNIQLANFPFIASNVKNSDGTPFIKSEDNNGEYYIAEISGKKIGFFGITTTETAYKTNPENVKGIEFENELLVSQEVIHKLEELECDLIVGLTHVGVASNELTSIDMAEALSGVDIIIDGHSHTNMVKKVSTGTYVVQTGAKLKRLGEITVTFTENNVKIEPKMLSKDEFKIYGKDSALEALYKKKVSELDIVLSQVIGKSDTDIVANKVYDRKKVISVVKNRETSMGDMVADSMIWGAKELLKDTKYKDMPMIAMTNGGSIKANIKAGDITLGDVYNVLPYGSSLAVKVVSPEDLYKTLEYSVSELKLNKDYTKIQNLSAAYPQIAGMRFEMDLTKTAYKEGATDGQRIVAIYIKNSDGTEKLISRNDNKTEIVFVSNDFLIAGGDGFTMLAELENVAEGNVLDRVFANYITELTSKAGGCFSYKEDGNRSVEINICNK